LRIGLLLVWAIASFGLMYFARDLQKLAGTWPFSFWLAAQGIVLVFVLIVGVYAFLANRAERRFLSGLPEDGRS
jgi:cation/acetate symporter